MKTCARKQGKECANFSAFLYRHMNYVVLKRGCLEKGKPLFLLKQDSGLPRRYNRASLGSSGVVSYPIVLVGWSARWQLHSRITESDHTMLSGVLSLLNHTSDMVCITGSDTKDLHGDSPSTRVSFQRAKSNMQSTRGYGILVQKDSCPQKPCAQSPCPKKSSDFTLNFRA